MSRALKIECQTLEETADRLETAALKAGADVAEVCGSFYQKTRISLEKQDFHLASSDSGYSFGLRILKDQRQGFTSCNTIDPADLREVALRAVEMAGFAPRNPYQTIGSTENLPKEAAFNLFDEELYRVSLQTQKEWAKGLIGEATRDPRFRLNEGAVEIGAGVTLLMSSTGTHKRELEAAAGWSLMGMAVDGDKITSFDYFYEMARHPARLQEKLLTSTRDFCQMLLASLQTGPGRSYKGLVAFSPRAVVEVLLSGLSFHLNGRNVAEGTTRWGVKHIGERVLSPLLTVRDLPWLGDRSGASLFDREGVPTREIVGMDRGALRDYWLDSYAAKALDLPRSNGHARGGTSSVPGVGTFCLCIDPGEESEADLLARAGAAQKEMLLVHRFSGNVDPVTGDFSGVAKGAEWLSGGERAHFVKETLISGNLFDALGAGLFGMSRERRVISSAEEVPTILCDGISVTVSEA